MCVCPKGKGFLAVLVGLRKGDGAMAVGGEREGNTARRWAAFCLGVAQLLGGQEQRTDLRSGAGGGGKPSSRGTCHQEQTVRSRESRVLQF